MPNKRTLCVFVEERLRYKHELVFDIPDNVDEADIATALARAENGEHYKDVIYYLQKVGCKYRPEDSRRDDLSSPSEYEFEIEDYWKEEKAYEEH